MSTLRTLTPNLLEVAKKQMSKFVKEINLPTEIKESEKHLYHVIIVEANFNQAKLEATYKAHVQMFDDRSWLANKDRFKQIGLTNVYVIHDPTVKVEGENTTDKGGDNGSGADAGAGDKETPKEKRNRLIAEAKALGYEGALNAKNATFEEFIKNAQENGAGAGEKDPNNDNGGDKE